MPQYQILKEGPAGQFNPTGNTWTASVSDQATADAQADAQRQALQEADPSGTCYAMLYIAGT